MFTVRAQCDCLLALFLAAAAPCAAMESPVQSRIDRMGTENRVRISWEGGHRKLYHLQTKIHWNHPWLRINTEPLVAGSDPTVMSITQTVSYRQQFFRVVDAGLVWLEPGLFAMGSPPLERNRFAEEGPQFVAIITRGFWMAAHEVTQAEYLEATGTNPSLVNGGPHPYPEPDTDFGVDLRRPVERVSWLSATEHCESLTILEQLAGRLPEGYEYRLPTEAEWEYACRAGSDTPFHYGEEMRAGMANFDWRSEYHAGVGIVNVPEAPWPGRTTPVGSYQPNAWGLYDMHGNVWEWCSDFWRSFYAIGSYNDPTGPPTGTEHVMRGACWNYPAYRLRSAHRRPHTPDFKSGNVGFRIVLAPPLTPSNAN